MPAAARAGDWPERTVRMIVPFVAGAGADIVGRTFAEELAKALGQPVVVDNKGGAGGLMGTAEGARAPADGYTLLLTSQGTTVFNIGLYKAPGYDPLKDLAPVAVAGTLPNVLVVSPANPAATVADLVAQARAKPDELTYGSSGVGSSLHLSGVILEQRTGVRLQHVPYRGAPAAVLAVVERRGDDGLLQHADRAGPDQGRQAQGARRHLRGPLGHAARRADDDGSWRARLRGRHVAGLRAAGGARQARSSRASMPRSTASARTRRSGRSSWFRDSRCCRPARPKPPAS